MAVGCGSHQARIVDRDGGSAGLLGALTAVEDHAELVGWMPGALAPFVLALVPTAITAVSGWAASHTPRPDLDGAGRG
ncbi:MULTISPECIES: holin [Streptomyces]|uniref:holin n=1 Tax=Streptomyces TaxID=1883 RepID=UPI0029A3C3FA|nr:holin [Streptomyces sp. ME02-6978.2a]MDX3360585.1 holin [Streptomyces sp. ME02-6978.2a]